MMGAQEWVIDTWVLQTAQNPEDSESLDCLDFLIEVKNRHFIGLDHERNIWKEYEDNIRSNSHVESWWNSMISIGGKIVFRSGRLPNRNRKHLLEKLKFDKDDMKFVAVAFHGTSKFLVSEDSDYNDDVNSYLKEMLGIQVFKTGSALVKAQESLR